MDIEDIVEDNRENKEEDVEDIPNEDDENSQVSRSWIVILILIKKILHEFLLQAGFKSVCKIYSSLGEHIFCLRNILSWMFITELLISHNFLYYV